MAQDTWPSPDDSHAVTDVEYEQLVTPHYRDGIHGTSADTSVAYGDGLALQVKVRSGKYGSVRGHAWYSGTSDLTFAIGANGSGSTRIDRVVLGLSRSTWNVTAYVKAGIPGAGAPALTQNTGTTGTYEIPIAQVTVVNGASVINSGNVVADNWWITPAGINTPSSTAVPSDRPVGTRIWRTDIKQWRTWDGTDWVPDPGTAVLDLVSANLTIVGTLDGTERDIWTYSWTPPCPGLYRIATLTPYDGTSGEQALLKLWHDGGEVVRDVVEFNASSGFVARLPLSESVVVTTTSARTVKVTGVRIVGVNAWNARLLPRSLAIYYTGPSSIRATG